MSSSGDQASRTKSDKKATSSDDRGSIATHANGASKPTITVPTEAAAAVAAASRSVSPPTSSNLPLGGVPQAPRATGLTNGALDADSTHAMSALHRSSSDISSPPLKPTAPGPGPGPGRATPLTPAAPVSAPTEALPTAAAGTPRPGAKASPSPVPAPGSAGASTARSGSPRTRRVRLTVARIDPWSTMKLSFLVSVALGFALVVMAGMLWGILSAMGVFEQVDSVVVEILSGSQGAESFSILNFVGFGRVMSLAVVVAVIDVVLFTAICTLGAFLYNICVALVGGLQLTMSDD